MSILPGVFVNALKMLRLRKIHFKALLAILLFVVMFLCATTLKVSKWEIFVLNLALCKHIRVTKTLLHPTLYSKTGVNRGILFSYICSKT